MKALVTGGPGFSASHVAEAYLAEGHEVVVVDNLSRGKLENLPVRARFYRADIRDAVAMEDNFVKEKPEIANHLAAQIDVRRSVAEPTFDAECNILGSINLPVLAIKHHCRCFIFASTGGAIYGEPKVLPANEGTPRILWRPTESANSRSSITFSAITGFMTSRMWYYATAMFTGPDKAAKARQA